MGYAAISDDRNDPVMQAIQQKFAEQANGPPTNILPNAVQNAAATFVRSHNANAKPAAVASLVQAMHSDPDLMQTIMSTYGPDAATEYGGGNGNVQQPQDVQHVARPAQSQTGQTPTQGLPPISAPQGPPTSAPGIAGRDDVQQSMQPDAAEGMDPELAAALGFGGGAAAGGAAGYMFSRRGNASPPLGTPTPPAVPTPPVVADPRMQAAVMGEPVHAPNVPVEDMDDLLPGDNPHGLTHTDMRDYHNKMTGYDGTETPNIKSYDETVAARSSDDSIPSHMQDGVQERPKGRKYDKLNKQSDAQDEHMRSIIMEASPASPATQVTESPTQEEAKVKPSTRTKKKAAETAPVEEAPKKKRAKRGSKKNADEPSNDKLMSGVERASPEEVDSKFKIDVALDEYKPPSTEPFDKLKDAFKDKDKVARAVKKIREAKASSNSLEDKIDTVALEATEAEKPKATKKRSRLDVKSEGAAGPSMSLREAKGILSENPPDTVYDKFNQGEPGAWAEARKRAANMIKAAKSMSKNEGVKIKGDDAVMKAFDDTPILLKKDDNRALAEALARRRAK